MQLTSENQQKLQIAVLIYSIRLSFIYLIRGVCKGFFFSCLYTALLNVAKKKRNFDIGEEHERRNRRHEETKKKKPRQEKNEEEMEKKTLTRKK
jgi:mannitol-specific phosphotransferase system IIBC component